jgi:hypothetical protein
MEIAHAVGKHDFIICVSVNSLFADSVCNGLGHGSRWPSCSAVAAFLFCRSCINCEVTVALELLRGVLAAFYGEQSGFNRKVDAHGTCSSNVRAFFSVGELPHGRPFSNDAVLRYPGSFPDHEEPLATCCAGSLSQYFLHAPTTAIIILGESK